MEWICLPLVLAPIDADVNMHVKTPRDSHTMANNQDIGMHTYINWILSVRMTDFSQ